MPEISIRLQNDYAGGCTPRQPSLYVVTADIPKKITYRYTVPKEKYSSRNTEIGLTYRATLGGKFDPDLELDHHDQTPLQLLLRPRRDFRSCNRRWDNRTTISLARCISKHRANRRRRNSSISGMLYQHSFWYRASQRVFEDVLKADPECGIAYWGIALSLLWNPHVPPPAKNLAEGAAAIAKGKSVGAKTQRERDYLDALGAMYADYEKVDHRTRMQAYAKAMEQLAQRYPER